MKQFFGESVVLSFLIIVVAIAIVSNILPVFNTLSGKDISLGALLNVNFILALISIAFLTGILSGSYPALFLSSFQPVVVLKNSFRTGLKGALFRKILVIFQFSLMIILIIGTIVIYNQLEYIQNSKLGFDKEHLISYR